MRRALRARALTGSNQRDKDMDQVIEGLMKGRKVGEIPPEDLQHLITVLTARRKDCLLHGQDARAQKMEEILSELKYGPDKFEIDTPYDPVATRTMRMTKSRNLDALESHTIRKDIMHGRATSELAPRNRQVVMPNMKNSRQTKVARINYASSDRYDRAIDSLDEYTIDSRRLGPRFQKEEAIQRKLDEARAHYNQVRLQVHTTRQQYDALEAAAADELEKKLSEEALEYGSHVPQSLPLEYSKFSANALDLRERQAKAARFRMYDDAASFRKQALALEKKQLQQHNEQFERAFNLNKKYLNKKMDEKRECFREIWRRKKEKVTRDTTAELRQAKRAIENLERELAEAQKSSDKEMSRIRRNERVAYTPLASRQASH